MTYEFECPDHGVFEVFFCSIGTKFYNCEKCALPCERIWSIPQIGAWSASLWNTRYGDSTKLYENLHRTGRFIKEPGVENDTKENEKRYLEKKTKALEDKVDKFVKERTLDELRAGIRTDAAILEAQRTGNRGKLEELKVPTSIKQVEKVANTVKPIVKRRRSNERTRRNG